VQKGAVRQFQSPRRSGQARQPPQPTPSRHHQPERHKGSGSTEHLAVITLNVKTSHVPGPVRLTQSSAFFAHVQPRHRLPWSKRLIQGNFPPTQRARTVKHHSECVAAWVLQIVLCLAHSACSRSCCRVTISNALAWVASRWTGGATSACSASRQRVAHRHHLSPGFKPAKRLSGRAVVKSFPRDREKARNSAVTRAHTTWVP